MLQSLTFNAQIISILYIGSPKVLYDVLPYFVLNKFVHARLDHLCLVVRETNFGPPFTPKLEICHRRAHQLNTLVHHNSDLV